VSQSKYIVLLRPQRLVTLGRLFCYLVSAMPVIHNIPKNVPAGS